MRAPVFRMLLLAALAHAPAHAKQTLIHMDIEEAQAGQAKPLRMTLREIERTPTRSVIDVSYRSGASVPSSMFVFKGMCAVAEDRGAAYFRTLSETRTAQGATRHTLGFSDRPNGAGLAPPAGATDAGDVLSVEQHCKVLGFTKP